MKKFLLLLVGVLFALSANAWTFYVDVAKTGWSSTSTPYLYAGEWNSTANNNTGAIQYHVKKQGTLVSGSIYKFDFSYGSNFDRFIISTKGEFEVNGGDFSSEVDKENTYGVFFKNNGYNANFKFNDKCFLVLHAPNTDGGADYYDTTYQIRGDLNGGDLNGADWSSEALTFTIQDGKFICDASTYKSLSGSFKVYDIKNDTWYGGSFISVDSQIPLSTSGDNISISAISNPVFELVNDNGNLKLTITENSSTPTTYYYRFHGTIFTSGDAHEGDWYTQKCMTDNGDGTYSFDATVKAGNFGIKELTDPTAINSSNKWIRAASGTDTINTANKTYAVAYKGGTNDGGANLSSTLTGEYTIVFNKKDMTITFVRKVATVDYTIYFDAVRSGWESLTVTGVTATVEDDGTKALKKISYSAAEGTEVTFSNGTNSYKVIPTNGNVYYVESSSLKGDLAYNDYSYTPPTPVVKTAYTIYFDTFQSGWRNVTLLNEGVEVVGSLVKTGYIHGANEDGVEGYLHKYTVNTTDATKLTFTNGTASYTLNTITDGNVYYVSKSGLADAPHASYKVNAAASYRLHGSILGNSSWDTYKMTYFDGLWIYEADNFVAGNFGIKKLGVDEAVDKSSTSPNPWIYAVTTDKNAHHVVIGATTNCALEGSEQATEKSGNFYSSVKGKYTLVFDPEAMTVMFINPAVAATATVSVEPVSTTSHANKLSLYIKVGDYSSVTSGYDLSNGTFTATSTDGNFANVPYASNYTLTVGSASMPINIAMPAEPTFDIKAINATTFAPAAGQNKGILSVAFTVETTWAYNLPHVICTCNGVVVPGNVEWSTNGFTFSAAEAVPLDGNAIKTDMTFKFVITPEYPFMVKSASTRGQMRVAGTGYQTVLGTAITNAEATLKGGNIVSGVEGVVIEAEDAPVEYFNLQGQRVNGDLAPGIYIRRQGTTVTKVRF